MTSEIVSEKYKEAIMLTIKAIAHFLRTKYGFKGKKLKVIVNKIFHIDHIKQTPREIFKIAIPQVEIGDTQLSKDGFMILLMSRWMKKTLKD